MNSFFNLISDFFDSFRNRLKNTFLSVFTISFILSNWELFLFLVYSEKSIEIKLEKVKYIYSDVNTLLFLPLGATLFYLIVLPYIMIGLDLLTNHAKTKRIDFQHKSTLAELDRKIIIANREFKIEKEKSGKADQEQLREEIETNKKEIETRKKELEKTKKELIAEKNKMFSNDEHINNLNEEIVNLRKQVNNIDISSRPFHHYSVALSKEKIDQILNEFRAKPLDLFISAYFKEIELYARDHIPAKNIFSDNILKKFIQKGIIEFGKDDTIILTEKGKVYWNEYLDYLNK